MNTILSSSHPEIELRPSIFSSLRTSKALKAGPTILDLLEVYPDHVNWKERLDHSSLLNHFEAKDMSSRECPQPLRIFFVDKLDFVNPQRLKAEPCLERNTTAYWMRQQFGVSPLFFSLILAENQHLQSGNASLKRVENEKCVAVDGLYPLELVSRMQDGHLCHVWFSHSLTDMQSSTYVIHGCPKQAKDHLVAYAHSKKFPMLLRPLVIDTFFADYTLDTWSQETLIHRCSLINYEKGSVLNFSPEQTSEAVETLHALSKNFHTIQGELNDLQDRLQHFLRLHQRLMEFSNHADDSSVRDSLEYLSSKTSKIIRWTQNYTKRTGIRINLFFNLDTRADSRTNLEIARLSSSIAVSTQKDSSSMIMVAALTMFFLPGTFVSTIFSMVFFDVKTSENGRESLTIGSQWWLFPAITIPLTIIVFAIWVRWQQYHNKMRPGDLKDLMFKM